MLNTKALSALLTSNTDHRLYKRWYLMTPNGTLLAHTQPADIKDLRRHAALAALSWQSHHQVESFTSSDDFIDPQSANENPNPRTIVVETDTHNTLIRFVQTQLVLVLEGGVPPRKKSWGTKTWVASADGELQRFQSPRQENLTNDEDLAASISTLGTPSGRGQASRGVLTMQRAKLDAMADALVEEFARSGFQMPGDASKTSF